MRDERHFEEPDEQAGKEAADPLEAMRSELLALLKARSPEVEEAIVARGLDIDPVANATPEGLASLRVAANESMDFIAALIERGADWTPSVPAAVAAHVRYLARNDVTLDAVMRGYYAITNVCLEFLGEEIAALPEDALPYLVGIQSRHGDRLMSAISVEHQNEVARLDRSPNSQRLAKRVQRLLAGEPTDTAELDYDLDAWHLGVIAVGAKAEPVTRRLAERLGCRLLLLPRGVETAWAWLGANRAIPFDEIERFASSNVDSSVSLAVGEPRKGVDGWRLTHQESQTALEVMLRRPRRLVRCSDVVLLATVMRDEETSRFLVDAYLAPLDLRRDSQVLRQTLRTYFASGCNAASAAAALGVDRHTVQRRLRKVEESIGRPLETCRAELDVALLVEQLADSGGGDR
jgi:hypothetical protein